MWSKERIREDLEELRILPGDSLILHGSMRSVGEVKGGAESVIDALLEIVGPEGTIMAPAFSNVRRIREGDQVPQAGDIHSANIGILAVILASRPDSARSRHRAFGFTALGKNAEFLTANAPFHFPLGANSPLAKLYQLNGGILLIGTGHNTNCAVHLAEAWADVPYGRRKAIVPNEQEEWQEMQGTPECSRGFRKIEPVLRQARILREAYVGNAPSQYMRIQYAVTMAIEMLRGNPESLLCDEPDCAPCTHARTFTRNPRPLDEKR